MVKMAAAIRDGLVGLLLYIIFGLCALVAVTVSLLIEVATKKGQ